MRIKYLIVAFLIVHPIQIILNKPAPQPVQAQQQTPPQAPTKALKKKVVKDATPKKKAPVEAPRVVQPSATVPNSNSVVSIITKAANKHGIDVSRALRIATCESTLDPTRVNYGYYAGGGHPTGLFQYLPETWNRIGSRSPYGVGNIYSAQDQANVTMWAWANGYAGEWECK